MPRPSLRPVFFVFAAILLTAIHSPAEDLKSKQATLNDGYSLFYDFCQQESQLSLLLWVKTAPADIADYAKRISATAKDDLSTLEKFRDHDRGLQLTKVSLPVFEQEVRKSMADDRKDNLIFKKSGAAFAQAISMSQGEVTNYGLHVAKVLSESEPDPVRAKAMRNIYQKWAALHGESYKLAR